MTRIVGGVAGGRRLHTPAGPGVRPTSERVREALFSSLESDLGGLDGVRFLDLYAGSGAVGLEAVSRGAAKALLVEQDRASAALARRNAAELGFGCVEVMTVRVERLIRAAPAERGHDVTFLDPPYAMRAADLDAVLIGLRHRGWLAPDSIVVVERGSRAGELSWPSGFAADRRRRYGDTTLWYGRAAGEA